MTQANESDFPPDWENNLLKTAVNEGRLKPGATLDDFKGLPEAIRTQVEETLAMDYPHEHRR